MGAITIRIALATGIALGASALGTDGASATPAFDHGLTAAVAAGQNVEQVRWVCGPYRCWRRPGHYWGGDYYGGNPYWGHRSRRWGYGGYGNGGYGWGYGNGGYGYRNPCD